MKQVAAVRHIERKGRIIFKWAKTCSGTREKVFAAMVAAQAVEGGKLHDGDIVSVGYNAIADQIIMASPGRSRISTKVKLEATDAEAVATRLGWDIERVEIADDAPAVAHKCPWEWADGLR